MCACEPGWTCPRCRETNADDVYVDFHEPDPPEPFSSEGRGE